MGTRKPRYRLVDGLKYRLRGDLVKFFKIIIPNYNNEKWLDKCLGSVFNQTFKDFKVVVIDDMSTDKSIEIINKYDVTLIRPDHRVYNGGARNWGIRYPIESKYTLFLDSDDWLRYDNSLEIIHDRLVKNHVDCLSLSYHLVYTNGEEDYHLKRNNRKDLVWSDCGACWTKVIKTELIKEFPENTLMEDTIQHINQCNYLETFDSLEEAVISYNRTNVESLTHPNKKPNIKWQSSVFRYVADLKELWCPNEDCEERRLHSLERVIQEIKDGVWGKW